MKTFTLMTGILALVVGLFCGACMVFHIMHHNLGFAIVNGGFFVINTIWGILLFRARS